jgi:hypothetical protein
MASGEDYQSRIALGSATGDGCPALPTRPKRSARKEARTVFLALPMQKVASSRYVNDTDTPVRPYFPPMGEVRSEPCSPVSPAGGVVVWKMKRAFEKKGGTKRELKRAIGRGADCAQCRLPMTRFCHGKDWQPTPNTTVSLFWDECRSCGHVQFYDTDKDGSPVRVRIDNIDNKESESVSAVTKLGRSNRTCTRCGTPMSRWFDKRRSVTWDQCPQCKNRTRPVSVPNPTKLTGPSYRNLQKERLSQERADTVAFVERARSPWALVKKGG